MKKTKYLDVNEAVQFNLSNLKDAEFDDEDRVVSKKRSNGGLSKKDKKREEREQKLREAQYKRDYYKASKLPWSNAFDQNN